MEYQERQKPAPLPGSWANVGGRLGVSMVEGSGLSYAPSSGYDPHMAVCTDVLYGSYAQGPKHFKAGDQVARRLILWFVELSPHQTAALTRSVRIEDQAGHQVLRFKLPEGGEAEVPLF